ncbi:MAG: hypothetical protein Q4F84_08155, partial [Fibrobacter sp.]|nr:hypothetical protein [Fibrobacter sp.]
MKNLRIVSIFLALLILPFSAFSIDNEPEQSFEYGKRLLLKMREKIYNFEIYDTSIYSNLAKCSLIFACESNRLDGLYWNAMSKFLYGLAKMGTNDKKIAFEYLEKGRLMLTQAIKAHGESSEVYLLLSDIYIQLLSCKGLGYKLANIRKLKEYPEKALSLDPANVKAHNPLAL